MKKFIRKSITRAISLTMAAFIIAISLPLTGFAKETDKSYVTEGNYQFTSNENSNIQNSGSFVYRDDCFMHSSFIGCSHLTTLSLEAAMASTSYYGSSTDKYEKDTSDGGHNVKEMLKAMGFENIEDNRYYHMEMMVNSAGVAVGSKTMSVGGKDYTLLAIVTRSSGYKQEWGGNFDVGSGDIHEGFKAARDEVLRFVKQYIQKNNIKGNLKVWVPGYSRGAAIANLTGAFFAGGGIEYFGSDVSITPEDVYCFTYATPRNVKNGASKNEVFSVSGKRSGEYVAYDTPGDAWNYTAGGTVDIHDECYNGIRNFTFDYDMITALPPKNWGFERFGQVLDLRKEPYAVSEAEMEAELQNIGDYAVQSLQKGNVLNFKDVTLNPSEIKNISIDETSEVPILDQLLSNENLFVGDDKGEAGYLQVLDERLNALVTVAGTDSEFAANGTQDTLVALAGIFGMVGFQYGSDLVGDDVSVLVKPLLLTYLTYASEALIAEGRAQNETEAISIALLELLDWLSEKGVGADDIESFTTDDFVVMLATYITENKDTPLIQKLKESLNAQDTSSSMVLMYFDMLFSRYCSTQVIPFGDALIGACDTFVNGPDQETTFTDDFVYYHPDDEITAQCARYNLYSQLSTILSLLPMFMSVDPIDTAFLGNAVGDKDDMLDGSGKFTGMIAAFLPLLLKDENDNPLTLTQAADASLSQALTTAENNVFAAIEAKAPGAYSEEYINSLHGHFATLRNHTANVRNIANHLLFYKEGGSFSTEYNIHNLASLLYNAGIVPTSHYSETYLAWAICSEQKSVDDEHYIEHIEKKDKTCTKSGNKEYWLLHEKSGDRYFTDSELSKEMTKDEVTIAAKGHLAGEIHIENEVSATVGKQGSYDQVQYCSICGERVVCIHVTTPAKEEVKPVTPSKPSSNPVVVPTEPEKEKSSEKPKKEEKKEDKNEEEIKEDTSEESSEKIVPFVPVDEIEVTPAEPQRKVSLPLPAWIGIIAGGVLLIGFIIFIILYNNRDSEK